MIKEYADRCIECALFDPVYDQCRLFGTVRADDMACVEFQPEE